MRETCFLRQSGDAHRSPKASAPVATLDCGEDHRFGVWADLWGRLSNLQKGRELGHFFDAPAPCEKPTSCVKAVMLTAVQRLAPKSPGALWGDRTFTMVPKKFSSTTAAEDAENSHRSKKHCTAWLWNVNNAKVVHCESAYP